MSGKTSHINMRVKPGSLADFRTKPRVITPGAVDLVADHRGAFPVDETIHMHIQPLEIRKLEAQIAHVQQVRGSTAYGCQINGPKRRSDWSAWY